MFPNELKISVTRANEQVFERIEAEFFKRFVKYNGPTWNCLLSLLRRIIFFSRASLAAWCLEVRQGRARPALLKCRYFLLPLITFFL